MCAQAAQADLARQMREAAQSSPLDNHRLERQQVINHSPLQEVCCMQAVVGFS